MPFTTNRKRAATISSGSPDNKPNKPEQIAGARKGSLKALFALSAPHLDKFLLAVGCILMMNGAVLLKPWLLKVVIDDILIGRKPQTFLFNLVTMAVVYRMTVSNTSK